jgi:hypothetical protein
VIFLPSGVGGVDAMEEEVTVWATQKIFGFQKMDLFSETPLDETCHLAHSKGSKLTEITSCLKLVTPLVLRARKIA